MLNTRALGEVFKKHSDDRLYKRWYLMTPNGTLLAYRQPADISDLRMNTAKAAIVWQEHQTPQRSESATEDDTTKASMPTLLRTLTVEAESGNTIIRKIQPQMLLVLEGGVPPRKRTFEPRVTPEGPGDAPYPTGAAQQADSTLNSSASSVAESTKSSVVPGGVLGLQRRKLDVLAAMIAQSFEQTAFRMPDEGSTKYF
ncbi:uncharacterized protein LTR77_010266 [Saxophila tyrrhenica]|uniref:PH domain-containing protein n=1 Tax=Saxophila tyrrhenica TaxID=1690608 RepID=A0AAV9NZA7_9PEZI|nr:hypothetical protein LTR77_010266 [Saxophila tyrrhenica]